jgi:hypothetical protein
VENGRDQAAKMLEAIRREKTDQGMSTVLAATIDASLEMIVATIDASLEMIVENDVTAETEMTAANGRDGGDVFRRAGVIATTAGTKGAGVTETGTGIGIATGIGILPVKRMFPLVHRRTAKASLRSQAKDLVSSDSVIAILHKLRTTFL